MLKTLRQSETGAGSFDRLKTQTLIEVVMTLVYSDVMQLVQETLVEDLARQHEQVQLHLGCRWKRSYPF